MTKSAKIVVILLPVGLFSCWMGMMLVHETGHMLAALASGGHVQKLIFTPGSFSRTDISPNPHPLLVAWAGPVGGASLPYLIIAGLRLLHIKSYYAQVFSAFCLLANGAYIGLGSFDRIGDAGDLIKYGSPRWALWLFGAATVTTFILKLHLLGPKLGLTSRPQPVDALLAVCLASLMLFLSFAVS